VWKCLYGTLLELTWRRKRGCAYVVDAANARYNISVLAASPHPTSRQLLTPTPRLSGPHLHPVHWFLAFCYLAVLFPPRLPDSTCSSNLARGIAMDIMTRTTTLPRAFETSPRNDTVNPTSQRKGKISDVHRCGTCFRTFNRREHRIRHERCRTFCTLTPAT
jgi:hypothetical protein